MPHDPADAAEQRGHGEVVRRSALEDAARACFASPAGQIVLRHLRRHVVERRVPLTASDAELRHVEGQRALAAWLIGLASRDAGSR